MSPDATLLSLLALLIVSTVAIFVLPPLLARFNRNR